MSCISVYGKSQCLWDLCIPALLQDSFHFLLVMLDLEARIWKGIGHLAQGIPVFQAWWVNGSLSFHCFSSDSPAPTNMLKAVSQRTDRVKHWSLPANCGPHKKIRLCFQSLPRKYLMACYGPTKGTERKILSTLLKLPHKSVNTLDFLFLPKEFA